MKNTISRRQFLKASGAVAAAGCAAGLLAGCGGSGSSSAASGSTGASGLSTTKYTILYDSQPSTQNYLITGSEVEMFTGANCVDTLLEFNNKGVLKEGLATDWQWDADTLTWTFTLREENWVDSTGAVLGPVTAQDFVDSMKYVLDPANAASNTRLITSYIAGAEDYFDYWTYRASAEAGQTDDDGTAYVMDGDTVVITSADGEETRYEKVEFEAVGVNAVDEHTLQYTLTYDFPGFLSLLVYLPYEPAYGPMLEEFGDQFATTAESVANCGAYYLSEYESLESWIMTKNPENYDADNVFVEEIKRIYNAEAITIGPEMVKRGEIDEATIGSDILEDWMSNEETKALVSMDRPNTNYTYFYIFNFLPYAHTFPQGEVSGMDAAYEPDNWTKAVNSLNFRKSIQCAINNDLTLSILAPYGFENYKLNTITPPSFCANDDGVDFTEIGDLDALGNFYDEAKAQEYRDAARAELEAAGCTFPIKVAVPYNPSTSDWDKECQVLKQQLETVLGSDYISINIVEGPADNFLTSIRRNANYAFLKSNWGCDYADPETESDPFYQAEGTRGSRYNFMRTGVEDGYITGETADTIMAYMTKVEEAKAITTDINARYEAFAAAEAILINNALVLPISMSVPEYLATRLNYWEGQYASTGFSNKRFKGIHLADHYISMEEYEANRDAR